MLIERLSLQERYHYQQQLIDFETQFSYPAHEGVFSISHAPYYFDFFDGLRFTCAPTEAFVALDDDKQLCGVILVVLQQLPTLQGKTTAWYLCDWKIKPGPHSRRILFGLFQALKAYCPSICDRGYALSMNPDEGANRIVHFARRNPFWRFSMLETPLQLFALPVNREEEIWQTLQSAYPELCLVSSKKSLMINSNKINIWYVLKDSSQIRQSIDWKTAVGAHDLLLWSDSACFPYLSAMTPFGSTSILQSGLNDVLWDQLMVCDI